MAQQKFFSGLTEGMINRASGERPDRQKTHFYWPDEYAPDPEPPAPSINGRAKLNRRSSDVPSTDQHSTWEPPVTTTTIPTTTTPPFRDRPVKRAESHIQFYDGVGSSFGELERSKAHERHRIEQFLRQQSEEETGEAARAKRLSTLQSKIEFYDYCPPVANGSVGRRANGELAYEQDAGDEELDFDDRSSICSSNHTTPTSGHRPRLAELPEHKRHSQRHLRSSINFHNGCAIADDREDPRKPVTVRESATARVVVGLPNL
uniref:Uncharacterized protein n=1 Tax=Anopheles epiroticus TaxID=199890 RepID=A0A182P7M8_9DIPT